MCWLLLVAAAVRPHCCTIKHPVPLPPTPACFSVNAFPTCVFAASTPRYDRELGAFVVRLPNGQEDFLLDAAVGAGCLTLAGSLRCLTALLGAWKHQQVAKYAAVLTAQQQVLLSWHVCLGSLSLGAGGAPQRHLCPFNQRVDGREDAQVGAGVHMLGLEIS